MKQRTIHRETSIKGKGLHTGEQVQMTFKPAPDNHGVIFRRVDLYGKPEIKPRADVVSDIMRSTSISSGHITLNTVEHILSALSGTEVDNVLIEIDASEPPILDGSAKPFVNLIQKAEPIEQKTERDYFVLKEPVSVSRGNSSYIALPYNGLKISCTFTDDRGGSHTQHLSLDINPQSYIADIAPARTFAFFEEVESLRQMGKIRGGSLDNAILIKGNTILSKEPLRFKDELVRHKILDILGDIAHLGKPLRAHIIAVRPSHALNHALTQAIYDKLQIESNGRQKNEKQSSSVIVSPAETTLDIRHILDLLPHRYPFVMIDRVTDIKEDNELVAIKNVSINEPYFQGHYPGRPIMPAVLQIEAMAQAAGVLLLRQISGDGKVALFMSCDKVKLRYPVVPGDQLEIRVKLDKVRGGKIAKASAFCKVGKKNVSSCELMFALVDDADGV